MHHSQKYSFDTPATYRIVINGSLDRTWFRNIYEMDIVVNSRAAGVQETTLKGELIDQAALIGVLNTLYNMGFTLLNVERIIES